MMVPMMARKLPPVEICQGAQNVKSKLFVKARCTRCGTVFQIGCSAALKCPYCDRKSKGASDGSP